MIKRFQFTCVRPLNEELSCDSLHFLTARQTSSHSGPGLFDFDYISKTWPQHIFNHSPFHNSPVFISIFLWFYECLSLFFTYVPFMCSPGGAGLHVQSDRGDRSSDDAQGLCYSWMGGQLGSHHISRVHEVLQRCSSRGNSALAVKPETSVETK